MADITEFPIKTVTVDLDSVVAAAGLALDFRASEAGGSVTTGRNVAVGDPGNEIASDLGSCTISGGGREGFENIIGGAPDNVGTATSNVAATGTGADYSVITGGYDNVAGGLASVISGFHNYTTSATSHGTISGGSVHKIEDGDYNTIGGGQTNTISDGDYCTISGGGGHTIDLPSGEDGGTISGGFNHAITARYATISGGNQNTASGAAATVSGGRYNTASGETSAIAGGDTNVAGGTGSFAGGGYNNTLSNTSARSDHSAAVAGYQNSIGTSSAARFSGALSGRSNSIQGEYSFTLAGRDCQALAESCGAMGYGAVANVPGQFARAGGYFSAAGDAQSSFIVLRRQTTDATPAELRAGSTLGARLTLSTDSVYAFLALVVARNTGADQGAAYKLEGCITRSAGGIVSFIGTPTVTVLGESNSAWDCSVAADTTNHTLQINVTGAAATTINWVGDVWLTKVAG